MMDPRSSWLHGSWARATVIQYEVPSVLVVYIVSSITVYALLVWHLAVLVSRISKK